MDATVEYIHLIQTADALLTYYMCTIYIQDLDKVLNVILPKNKYCEFCPQSLALKVHWKNVHMVPRVEEFYRLTLGAWIK